MAKSFKFTSPFSAQECTQCLRQVAAQRHFYFKAGYFTLHINISSIDFPSNRNPPAPFLIHAIGSPHTSLGLPAILYFKLAGGLEPSGAATTVKSRLQLHYPFATADWVILVFWYAVILVALAGGTIAALLSPVEQGILIAAIFLLGGAAYTGLLRQVHQQAIRNLPALLYQALTSPEMPPHTWGSSPPGWLSSLSKPP